MRKMQLKLFYELEYLKLDLVSSKEKEAGRTGRIQEVSGGEPLGVARGEIVIPLTETATMHGVC